METFALSLVSISQGIRSFQCFLPGETILTVRITSEVATVMLHGPSRRVAHNASLYGEGAAGSRCYIN